MDCLRCRHGIAQGAAVCPHCGWDTGSAWIAEQVGAAVTFALFGIAAWFFFVPK